MHTVAIGASAGGIEALRSLLAPLPSGFPAAVLVVLHLPPKGTSVLPQILDRAGALPAVTAVDGAPVEGGCVYVAPPDCHLLVEDGRLRLDHGARTNGHRPAIDPLFRSVAEEHRSASAGVVLSGVLHDGTAGLMAIKQAGGVTLAQDPAEALYDMMPRTAIEVVSPDYVGTAEQLGKVLAEIAIAVPPDPPAALHAVREELLIEVDRGSSDDPQPGRVTGLFDAAPTERAEAALWTALRTLEERAALYRRMAARHRESGNTRTSERFSLRAESAVQHAFVIRDVIHQFGGELAGEEGAA